VDISLGLAPLKSSQNKTKYINIVIIPSRMRDEEMPFIRLTTLSPRIMMKALATSR
jgi:hypothetical protein